MAKPIKKSLKKKSYGRKRSTSEMIWIVISIFLVLAMVVTSFAAIFMSAAQ